MKRILMLLTLAGLAGYAPTAQAIPDQVNYQGYLTRPDGTPLDTTVAMTFVIHREDINFDYWTETHPAVVVTSGLFNVLLGSISPLDENMFAGDRTLGITVGNNSQMTPRRPIVSTIRALKVKTVEGATGGGILGDVWITGKAKIGMENDNSGNWAFVAGYQNEATGDYSTVPGGWHNTASGNRSVVGGGVSNTASQQSASVGGGNVNLAGGLGATVGGGVNNRARGDYSVVAGGGGATADSNSAGGGNSFIGGGKGNNASGLYSTISGGLNNTVGDISAVIGGGSGNIASGYHSFVGGGRYNRARGYLSAVAGGGGTFVSDSNSALGTYSFVGGGGNNVASGSYSVMGGGQANTASDGWNTVGGGYGNLTDGQYATIGGGSGNSMGNSGYYGTIGGGLNNYIGANYATIPGGLNNSVSGLYGFAAGKDVTVSGSNSSGLGTHINCNADSAFVWSDGSGSTLSIGSSRTFSVKATNGTRIWTNSDLTAGVRILAGASAWITACDSTKKRNIRGLDTQDILARFSSLPLKRWEYKSEDPGVEHIGPMAQDFWNAFHLGNEPLGISTLDADGVMMAAIQELAKRSNRIDELEKQIAELQTQIQSLLARDEQTHINQVD